MFTPAHHLASQVCINGNELGDGEVEVVDEGSTEVEVDLHQHINQDINGQAGRARATSNHRVGKGQNLSNGEASTGALLDDELGKGNLGNAPARIESIEAKVDGQDQDLPGKDSTTAVGRIGERSCEHTSPSVESQEYVHSIEHGEMDVETVEKISDHDPVGKAVGEHRTEVGLEVHNFQVVLPTVGLELAHRFDEAQVEVHLYQRVIRR